MLDGLRTPLLGTTRPLAEMAGRFRFNTTVFDLVVDGMRGEDWTRRVAGSSSALWVLGHLATMRLRLARLLGVEAPERAWEELFDGRTAPPAFERLAALQPRHDELVSAFRASDRPLVRALGSVGESEANGPRSAGEAGVEPPMTLGGLAGFFYFDETFHLGQLGLLREQLGRPRVP